MKRLAALGAAALAAIGMSTPRVSRQKQTRRRELQAAWRWYEPRPVTWDGAGPRPASSYRAARRNAHRPHMASVLLRAARRAGQAAPVQGGAP